MATYKRSEVTAGLTSRHRLPRNRYTLRCISEKSVVSKGKGNPQVERTYEICLPETVEIAGETVLISGTEVKQYLPVVVLEKGEVDKVASEKAAARFMEENRKIGLPCEEFDTENPIPESAVGKVVDAILTSDESVARLDPTPEEKAEGKLGKPIKDENGKDVITYRIGFPQILGLSSAEVPGF